MGDFTFLVLVLAAAVVLLGVVFASQFQRATVYDYQRGLRYQSGRFVDVLGSGSYWVFTPTTSIRIVDVRSSVLPLPGQELVTSDGVAIKLSLAVQRRLVDPAVAINDVENYTVSTYTILQVALREAVGAITIEDVLSRRGEIGSEVLQRSQEAARKIGVELESVDVKDLMLPAATKKLLNQVVDARQRGLAALETARGETAALRSLANAARMVEASPSLLQLRLLQQLDSTSGNTVLLGMPAATMPVPVRQVAPTTETPVAQKPSAESSSSPPE
jgi:regulator of protease activity HflC (stomatin/prohibitin superfamily)